MIVLTYLKSRSFHNHCEVEWLFWSKWKVCRYYISSTPSILGLLVNEHCVSVTFELEANVKVKGDVYDFIS